MICHENSENSLFSRKCAYDFIFVDHKDQIPVGKTEKNGKKTGHS